MTTSVNIVGAAVVLREPVFAHGQLYVALSRAGLSENIRVWISEGQTQGWRDKNVTGVEGTYTDNIVYRDILLGDGAAAWNKAKQARAHVAEDDDDVESKVAATTGDGLDFESDCSPRISGMLAGKLDLEIAMDASLLPASAEDENTDSDNEVPANQPIYTAYFERQLRGFGRCGLHALNNAVGFEFLTAADMSEACTVLLHELAMEDNPERRDDHELLTGWYSEAAMAQAFRVKQNIYRLDLDDPVQPNEGHLHRLYTEDVLGLVVNKDQEHWVAVRIVDEQIWLLDSLCTPQAITFDELLNFVRAYRHAFLVKSIKD